MVRLTRAPHARGYLRSVERPYGRVPVVGEQVMLDDGGEQGHAVDQVTWDNNGTAILRFSDPPVTHQWLAAAGFDQIVGDAVA